MGIIEKTRTWLVHGWIGVVGSKLFLVVEREEDRGMKETEGGTDTEVRAAEEETNLS